MKVDAVFSGGGVKAFAFIGALEALEDKSYKIERVAGSSAGAIVAGLLAAGYKVNELNQIMLNKDLKEVLDSTKLEKYFTNFNINNGLQFSKTLIGTMRHAQDLRYISKYEQPNIVFLDTDHVSLADFTLSRQVREELIETGKEKTNEFLIRPF